MDHHSIQTGPIPQTYQIILSPPIR